jgi:hypothetical protein
MTNTIPTQEQVDRVAAKLAPDVVRIRVHMKEDWEGDPALDFRVILSDEASRRERLSEIVRTVEAALNEELGLADSEYFPYIRYRSWSEQASLRDPKWE